MKLANSLILLASTAGGVLGEPTRTSVTVGFEYQLEVNSVARVGTTEDVLGNIDSEILGALQKALPNGGSQEGELPNVKFDKIDSEIFSACFTKSEQCSLVRSTISIHYEAEKPANSVEFVTLGLVQSYLKDYSRSNALVSISYAYPAIAFTRS